MGTFYNITVPGDYPGGVQALNQDAQKEFKVVIDAISSFDPTSEIARFNAQEDTRPMRISMYLAHVIEEVNHQALRIRGATDISVGPLVNLWGFGPEARPLHSPSQAELNAARAYVGPDKFEVRYVDGISFLHKTDPRVKLDLSTVGEGLGADRLADLLESKGIQNYMASVAGAIRTKGKNAQGKDWRIGIENPANPGGTPFAVVCPKGMAMSTSGSYRNYFVDDKTGKRYSHIINPATGKPIDHHTVSVTVIEHSTLVTDALDTGLMVLGADEALRWGDETETAIYTIEMKDGKPVGRYNRYFEPYLKCDVTPGK